MEGQGIGHGSEVRGSIGHLFPPPLTYCVGRSAAPPLLPRPGTSAAFISPPLSRAGHRAENKGGGRGESDEGAAVTRWEAARNVGRRGKCYCLMGCVLLATVPFSAFCFMPSDFPLLPRFLLPLVLLPSAVLQFILVF